MFQVKAKVEVQAGLTAEMCSLYLESAEEPLGEHTTVSMWGMPTKLIAVTLQKVVIADAAGVAALELTDEQLRSACSSPEGKDIVVLGGCEQVRKMNCLEMIEQMQVLDISGCTNMDAATVPIGRLK